MAAVYSTCSRLLATQPQTHKGVDFINTIYAGQDNYTLRLTFTSQLASQKNSLDCKWHYVQLLRFMKSIPVKAIQLIGPESRMV